MCLFFLTEIKWVTVTDSSDYVNCVQCVVNYAESVVNRPIRVTALVVVNAQSVRIAIFVVVTTAGQNAARIVIFVVVVTTIQNAVHVRILVENFVTTVSVLVVMC